MSNFDLTHCPLCKEKVDSFATCRADKPFTAKEPFEGLEAWGAYSAEKELLCFDGKYVHFRFISRDHFQVIPGESRLVELKEFNLEKIRDVQNQHANEYHQCEHEGCKEQGEPYYIRPFDEEPNGYYCTEHAQIEGFCWGCHLFAAGTERFDFGKSGLCGACEQDYEDETEEWYDEDADFGWDYPSSWYDPDMDFENEDANGVYIGDREDEDE